MMNGTGEYFVAVAIRSAAGDVWHYDRNRNAIQSAYG